MCFVFRERKRRTSTVAPPHVRPTTNGWYAKWKLGWNMYTLHKCFCTFGTDLYAQSVLINIISASELSRNLIKSALLVGYTVQTLSLSLSLSPPINGVGFF